MLDRDEFCLALLSALPAAVRADWCALNEVPAELPDTISLTHPLLPREVHETFAALSTQNPIAAHFLDTGDGRATRISDLVTRRELHRLELYQQVYRPLGIEYQIAFTLPSNAQRILGATLSRCARDFSARERDLLNLARPYLIQMYRNAIAHSELEAEPSLSVPALQARGLSRRQAQILRLVAAGRTTPQAATVLAITPRTAEKHLQQTYRALGVHTRADAVRVARAGGERS